MIYSSREVEKKFKSREEEGQSVFNRYISDRMSTSLDQLWSYYRYPKYGNGQDFANDVIDHLRFNGVNTLRMSIDQPFARIQERQDHDLLCDVIEAWLSVRSQSEQEDLEIVINTMLHRNRYDKKLVDRQFVPYSDSLANQGIINTFDVVCIGEDMKLVRELMHKALVEYGDSEYGDAITNAASGLQEFLRVKGFEGKTLWEQENLAVKAKFIKNDEKDNDVENYRDKLIWDWVRHTRNTFGSAHPGSTSATKEQTWSYLQVVGSLMERYSITEELEEQ